MGQFSSAARRTPPLSDLDLRILGLLSSHRVLTQNQLAAINSGTPARTLRYRCARLAEHGLAGRSRPYRERGSAPHHLWPTRKGEAVITGRPPPRGGERREPNPLFLAHAAGLSEIYVALITTLPTETSVTRFEREGEAREEFTARRSRDKRAIAPDVFIEIADRDGLPLLAFVELDMGTMSHRRLKQKAAGYAEYAKAEAWRERHRFCPALLFITTTEKRARAFLTAMGRALDGDSLLLTCGCDLARRLTRCAVEPRWWIDEESTETLDLLAILKEARRPFDEEHERRVVRRREEDAKRESLHRDPEALRSHLRSWRDRDWGIQRFDGQVATALKLTLEQDDQLASAERQALLALGALFADPLRPQLPEGELRYEERIVFEALIDRHRATQLDRIESLARECGDVLSLRRARRSVEAGGVLDDYQQAHLQPAAAQDQAEREQVEHLRDRYLDWREEEAERLAKAQSFATRLRNGPATFLDEIDRRSLRRCPRCDELVFPDPERAGYMPAERRNVASRCHFCGTTELAEIDPGEAAA